MPKGMATTYKHGHSTRKGESRVYVCWLNMRRRCDYPNSTQYQWYGARGIRVCERWAQFANFLSDMGEPKDGESLDRIDPNGDYEPNNCRWASKKEQVLNRRNTKFLTVGGVTKPVQVWADELGIKAKTIKFRLKKGYSPEAAIFTGEYPSDPRNNPSWARTGRTRLQADTSSEA